MPPRLAIRLISQVLQGLEYAHGLTDASGARVKEKPVQIQDFNATIGHALGVPHDLVMMSPTKRPFQMADKGSPVKEVFA